MIGHDVTHNFARTFSAIGKCDAHNMCVSTRSGRLYRLVGQPGNYPAVKIAWEVRCSSIVSLADVTDQHLNIDTFSTIDYERITRSVLREEDS